MNKLTREEIQEVNDLLFSWLDDFDASDFKEILSYLEQKKKQWQEEAYEEGKEDADFNNLVERDLSLD